MRKPNPDLENVHIFLNKQLVENLKKAYPEVKGLTYSGAVDFAVRLAIKMVEADEKWSLNRKSQA
jgi:hypothetical protein